MTGRVFEMVLMLPLVAIAIGNLTLVLHISECLYVWYSATTNVMFNCI